jgi:hypothetical protein
VKVVVATHGHCFDGLASAVLFTRLLGAVNGSKYSFVYRACGYGSGQNRTEAELFTGDENAILDYRFVASPKVSWFFDHHRTAFMTDDDRKLFDEIKPNGHFFYDPDYSSCTKLIADVAWRHYAVNDPQLHDLVHWADVVDSARFESPEQAISRESPIMRMVSVVEHYGDDSFLKKMVPELLRKPLAEVAKLKWIQDKYKPLDEKHQRYVERVRKSTERMGRVVFVDLTDGVLESISKFVTYALHPDSVYSVVVGMLKGGVKISVGYNPWSGAPLDTDISAICARHGGGGHPVVGAIAFKATEVDQARTIARAIAKELS